MLIVPRRITLRPPSFLFRAHSSLESLLAPAPDRSFPYLFQFESACVSVVVCVRACVCVCVRDLRRSVNCVPCVIREKPFCSVHENTSRRFGFFFASTASFAVLTNRFLCVPRRRRCRVHVEQHHGLRHAKTVARF